ncbi:MAG: hypothetical protein ABH864_05105 [archaeon]
MFYLFVDTHGTHRSTAAAHALKHKYALQGKHPKIGHLGIHGLVSLLDIEKMEAAHMAGTHGRPYQMELDINFQRYVDRVGTIHTTILGADQIFTMEHRMEAQIRHATGYAGEIVCLEVPERNSMGQGELEELFAEKLRCLD